MSSIGNYEKGQTKTDTERVGYGPGQNPYLDLAYDLAEKKALNRANQNLLFGGPGYLGSFQGATAGGQGPKGPTLYAPPGLPGGVGAGQQPWRNPPPSPPSTPSEYVAVGGGGGGDGGGGAINPFTGLPVGQLGAKSLYTPTPKGVPAPPPETLPSPYPLDWTPWIPTTGDDPTTGLPARPKAKDIPT